MHGTKSEITDVFLFPQIWYSVIIFVSADLEHIQSNAVICMWLVSSLKNLGLCTSHTRGLMIPFHYDPGCLEHDRALNYCLQGYT